MLDADVIDMVPAGRRRDGTPIFATEADAGQTASAVWNTAMATWALREPISVVSLLLGVGALAVDTFTSPARQRRR